uniref:Uncharacterized protein n=1 Tax=Trichobilharzia regenti TaxID=157069 RepID=A0AA85JE44_TRIRE|nr:unnamed protein product [Trichobilharzia regenti]
MAGKRARGRRRTISKVERKRSKAMIERSLILLNNHASVFRNEVHMRAQSSTENIKETDGFAEHLSDKKEEIVPCSGNTVEEATVEFSLMKCP